MHGQSEASTIEQYIAELEEPRRSEIQTIHEFIRRVVPNLEPHMSSKMPGYGPFHYKYASGREGDAARISVASNKQYISIYVLAACETGYLAEEYKDKLPKAKIGKSCIRFKKVSDLDWDVMEELMRKAETMSFGIG